MNIEPADVRILAESLPALQRLALAYAPRASRIQTLALLALDTRLAGIVRSSHEPMLAQLRLAWWRETLAQDAKDWPVGEPMLAALHSWNGMHQPLCSLADGWEAMTGATPLDAEAITSLANGRGAGFAALASAVGANNHVDCARSLGEEWALSDVIPRLGNDTESTTAAVLLEAKDSKHPRLPRSLRPLIVLHGVSMRVARRGREIARPGVLSFLAAVRLGLLGR